MSEAKSATANTDRKAEIGALTSIRGLAALWVVSYHLGNIWGPIFNFQPPPMLAHFIFGGAYCVDIFFVLSGYVLSYAYENGFDQRRFFINRIARIFPLHIVMFTVAISELLFLQHSAILQNDVILKFSFSLLFYYSLTFVWFDMPDIMGTPTWSLSAEFFAYFFFPTVRRIDFRKYPTATAGLLAGLIVAQGLILSQIGFKATGFWALARALVGFGFGATLYFVKIPKELPNWLAMPPCCGWSRVCAPAISVWRDCRQPCSSAIWVNQDPAFCTGCSTMAPPSGPAGFRIRSIWCTHPFWSAPKFSSTAPHCYQGAVSFLSPEPILPFCLASRR
jgi:peptidoglycan/LPS O-acetylase OafA/YrhL